MWPLGVLKKPDLLTVMNLRFNGADGSTVFTDSSLYNHTFSTFSGSPVISTAESISGGSSLYLPTNSSISTPDNADYEIGSSTYTIEFYIKPDLTLFANNAYQGVFAKGLTTFFNSNYSYYGYIKRDPSGNTGYFRFHYLIVSVGQAQTNVQVDLDFSVWNKIGIQRVAADRVKIYVNDVLAVTGGTHLQSYYNTDQPLYIGREVIHTGDFTTLAAKYTGYLDSFRIVKKALYV